MRKVRSNSGVVVITLVLAPGPPSDRRSQAARVLGPPSAVWNAELILSENALGRFSCPNDCHYCPNEPGQPRSYLRDEPAVLRANQNKFDAVMQFTERCATLAQNGHPVDKVELLVLGGTWASYPLDYREAFCRDLYYAANTFWDRVKRPRKS